MKKTLRRFGALVAGLLAGAPAAQAQQPAKPVPTAAELKKNIARLAQGTEGESVAFDKLNAATERQLVAYLKTHEVTAAAAKALGLGYTESKDADHLKVFTYSCSSGGTRGTINQPVLQWQNAAGQRFAYACHEECDFGKIYKLASPGRTLYLLLGQETGDTRCLTSQAYVVELRGNYLLLAPAFGTSPLLRLCNVEMDFDAAAQVLHLDLSDEEVPEYNDENLAKVGFRRQASTKQLALKFSGGRFVKSR
ncbi:hypothetical protein [Hymenobacter bucti]|uniref:Uncharacterized protein n=1 Tax=Hymenobacter bucti TaxID=1844114 RepID=A0ABW4QSZ2_9BACT